MSIFETTINIFTQPYSILIYVNTKDIVWRCPHPGHVNVSPGCSIRIFFVSGSLKLISPVSSLISSGLRSPNVAASIEVFKAGASFYSLSFILSLIFISVSSLFESSLLSLIFISVFMVSGLFVSSLFDESIGTLSHLSFCFLNLLRK